MADARYQTSEDASPLDAPVLEAVKVPRRGGGWRIIGTYSRMSMIELIALGEDATDMNLALYRLARDLRNLDLGDINY